MKLGIAISLTPDQVCAVNNALRRELEIQQRLIVDTSQIGVAEYVRHLDSALREVTASWERAHAFGAERVKR